MASSSQKHDVVKTNYNNSTNFIIYGTLCAPLTRRVVTRGTCMLSVYQTVKFCVTKQQPMQHNCMLFSHTLCSKNESYRKELMRLTSLVHFCRWWRVEQSTMLSVTDCSVPQRENKSRFVVAQIGRVFTCCWARHHSAAVAPVKLRS